MKAKSDLGAILVTGASGGIGEAICRLLVNKGHRVVASARSLAKLENLTDDLGDALQPMALDVTDADAVANLVAALPRGFDEIDVLINNAGHDSGGRRRFDEGSAEQAREFYAGFDACLQPEDVAATVALAQPPHVEVAQLVVLPV